MRTGFEKNLAGRQIDYEVVGVGVLSCKANFKFQGLFSVKERLFERVCHAPGACRVKRHGQEDGDGNREDQ